MAKVSLAELMGKKGAQAAGSRKLTVDDLHHILGDNLPEIPYDAVGHFRLTNALRQRFGADYRNVSGIKDILEDFDSRRDLEHRMSQLKRIKYEPKKAK